MIVSLLSPTPTIAPLEHPLPVCGFGGLSYPVIWVWVLLIRYFYRVPIIFLKRPRSSFNSP
jgi:hypothetical protein